MTLITSIPAEWHTTLKAQHADVRAALERILEEEVDGIARTRVEEIAGKVMSNLVRPSLFLKDSCDGRHVEAMWDLGAEAFGDSFDVDEDIPYAGFAARAHNLMELHEGLKRYGDLLPVDLATLGETGIGAFYHRALEEALIETTEVGMTPLAEIVRNFQPALTTEKVKLEEGFLTADEEAAVDSWLAWCDAQGFTPTDKKDRDLHRCQVQIGGFADTCQHEHTNDQILQLNVGEFSAHLILENGDLGIDLQFL